MNFDGTEGSIIDIKVGIEMTTAYRKAHPEDNLCVFFGREMLKELMDQPGAMGLRFYFAKNSDGKMAMVVAAANADGNDVLDKVGDTGVYCPSTCCTQSPLGNA